jgi:hypothetical protein
MRGGIKTRAFIGTTKVVPLPKRTSGTLAPTLTWRCITIVALSAPFDFARGKFNY